jgi:3',5'-nucleoside bisphosphate phosphatase
MISKGYVSSSQKAFDLYLKRGKPGYAERFRLSPEEGIKAIRGAGGVAVLAHPLTLELDSQALRKYMAELKHVGLQGIEVYYSEHSQTHVREYSALAAEFDLVKTGGSDFHGSSNPGIRLGVGFGSLSVPDRAVEELRRKREQKG